MECREVRHLLNEGVAPSSYDRVQTMLGFHLAMCADCRSYRIKLAARRNSELLLAVLLAQQPPLPSQQLSSPAKRRTRRAQRRAVQLTGAALAIGVMLAMSPASHATATQAESRPAAPAALEPHDDALVVDRQRYMRIEQTALDPAQALRQPEVQAAPATDQSQQTGIVHVVAFGESLWSIAQRYYNGDGTRWQTLYDGNRAVIGANPNLIYPGTRLTITQVETGPVGTGESPAAGTYVVQPGDSLWLIAQRHYGDGMAYQAIHQVNLDQIANPSLIYPGMSIRIP